MNKVVPMSCIKSTEYSIHTRHCFMTGEYCSQQTNIQKERQKLHSKMNDNRHAPEVNAFVVMNFSSMSDVVYESRIKPFIEGLKKYLFWDTMDNRIACISTGDLNNLEGDLSIEPDASAPSEDLLACRKKRWEPVQKIHVHRADSNPVSNYIICNRICQQMQTADLIVVDVSVESANVFYEFGLATAFQKLILPICFSESFYEMKLPDRLEAAIRTAQEQQAAWGTSGNNINRVKSYEKHIDCYPWRRKLFEHFGIRFQKDTMAPIEGSALQEYSGVRYLDSNIVFSEEFGFSDYDYNHFPYSELVAKENEKQPGECTENEDNANQTAGKKIYDWLRKSYNGIKPTTDSEYNGAYTHNTLVVYTMDQILNRNQAGQCIVNFYKNITRPMIDEYCFCGDRVAVLGQSNQIWDDPKDSKNGKELLYDVCDLIRIGMDQATFEAERKRIKTSDYMAQTPTKDFYKKYSAWIFSADQALKTHYRNRCILLNPSTPIHVIQLRDGLQKGILKNADTLCESKDRFFCLYHVMLDTMRYTNEIVVDLSSNSIQAMFWLGAAHGSDIPAITVRHEMSEKELAWAGASKVQKDRPIFDIGGLWTAMLRYNETKSFYKQLAMIQLGIEQHKKLMLPGAELETFEEDVSKEAYLPMDRSKHEESNADAPKSEKTESRDPLHKLILQKNRNESSALESYYRDSFWRHLLRENQLHLFLPMNDANEADGPRLHVVKWDVDTVAELSHYLSKRQIIGRYHFDTLRKDEFYGQNDATGKTLASDENFISIGEQTRPFRGESGPISLAKKINNDIDHKVKIMRRWIGKRGDSHSGISYPVQCRGFSSSSDSTASEFEMQFFQPTCNTCSGRPTMCNPTDCPQPLACPEPIRNLDFPEKIILTWKELSSSDIEPQLNVEYSPSQPNLTSIHFRFSKSNHDIYALIHCVFEPHNYTIPSSEPSLMYILKFMFPNGLTLECDNPDSIFSGRYIVQTNCSEQQNIQASVLSKCELRLQEDSTAVLYEIPQAMNASHKDYDFEMPAQLLLWREKRQEGGGTIKYWVSLAGVSGPATKALCSLLVDKEQKNRILNITKPDAACYLPLNSLQTHIRKQFFSELRTKLCNSFSDKKNTTLVEFDKVLYLVENYLSTILYQYFLPFLSHADEKRIHNAMQAFLLTLDSKNDDDFEALISDNTQLVLATLKELLNSFRGVEAMYKVKVHAAGNSNSTDDRQIISINEWPGSEDHGITCLYVSNSDPSKS